ncbi:hypothetical protein Bca4012_020752 [Brassica carinata]
MFVSLSYASRSGISKQKFEMNKHLNRLNKPAVKSFQHAIDYVEGDNYCGAKATINVWEPKRYINSSSTGSPSRRYGFSVTYSNNILTAKDAGWQVSRIYLVTIIQDSSLTGLTIV